MFLRVIFQETGNFEKGTIRAFGEKPDGWTKPDEVEIESLTATQKKAFAAVVATIQAKGEPWSATQVWVYSAIDPESDPAAPALWLVIEAQHDETGALKTFPDMYVTDASAIKLFNSLTK